LFSQVALKEFCHPITRCSEKPILAVRDIGVSFVRADGTPVVALKEVCLDVFRGEFLCILGRSGHGKTTLLNVVAGLLTAQRGQLQVMGQRVTGPGTDRGVIFQQDAVFPWMRVEENVAFGLRLIAPTVHIIRMTPFLAMIPLFNLWFGANTFGIILFVAYGVAVIMFIGTVNAVRNVPNVYLQRAATVGASGVTVFRCVMIPAIFPEIRASFLLSFGLSWSLVVGGELLGAQSGLGVIVTYALQFAYTGRVLITAILFILYAGLSFAAFEVISQRIIDWHPQVERTLKSIRASWVRP
jgi:ABC-type proline/glycine betaine transport system permease subunit